MTIDREEELFSEALLDLKLAIDDYGAEYFMRHFKQVYPVEYTHLRNALAAPRAIPILLKKKA